MNCLVRCYEMLTKTMAMVKYWIKTRRASNFWFFWYLEYLDVALETGDQRLYHILIFGVFWAFWYFDILIFDFDIWNIWRSECSAGYRGSMPLSHFPTSHNNLGSISWSYNPAISTFHNISLNKSIMFFRNNKLTSI